jgi:hypothetical protein
MTTQRRHASNPSGFDRRIVVCAAVVIAMQPTTKRVS